VTLGLLEGLGLEIELVIVDAATLDVRPLADRALFAAAGEGRGDHDAGRIGWSNELVNHVLELKMAGPEPELSTIAEAFQENVRTVEAQLEPHGARLMPTGMHPWMDPARETVLWPHEYGEVYQAYHRLFDCHRHGWANLQSVHLNLAFGSEREFARLHAAVRLVLPILPALAASSPVMEGRLTGLLDSRLEVYRTNATRIPSMTGPVIPEPIWDRATYRREILEPLERDVRALDDSGHLEGEWLNARGAIARFDRDAIEVRLLDTQECPAADVAVSWAVTCVVAALVEERWIDEAAQRAFDSAPLARTLGEAIAHGAEAPTPPDLARALGWAAGEPPSMGRLWRDLVERCVVPHRHTTAAHLEQLELIGTAGPLATRIVRALGPAPDRTRLGAVYGSLCDCLRRGRAFSG
jgi:carboxylate-amine ligase